MERINAPSLLVEWSIYRLCQPNLRYVKLVQTDMSHLIRKPFSVNYHYEVKVLVTFIFNCCSGIFMEKYLFDLTDASNYLGG